MPKIPFPPSLSLDVHIRRFFKRFDFDPDDLHGWRGLLIKLAGGRPGAPRKGDAWELAKLRFMVDLLHINHLRKPDTECCEELSKNKGDFRITSAGSKKGYYEGFDPETLWRKLQDARQPAMQRA